MTQNPSLRPSLDLSLYLVTDSTPVILGSGDLVHIVDEAIKGGVTVVQYRDKHADTGELVQMASKLHEITQHHGVPLLINDRVDVCLAVGAEGVHLGQDDMDIQAARKLLGEKCIIGISASTKEEARQAVDHGATYLGIGTMFATPTKEDTKSIIGTAGTRAILESIKDSTVGTVSIGGMNATNVQRVLHQSSGVSKKLDGVAVVSAIIASPDPQFSAQTLSSLIKTTSQKFYSPTPLDQPPISDVPELLNKVPSIIKQHVETNPLCHNMTNLVVQNFAANVCLATGSSPIMSNNGLEASDLAQFGGGLVINMGTVTPETLTNYLLAMKAYNAAGNPVLFDPVGGGATSIRREAVKKLLAGGFFDVIKGNEGEIKTVLGAADAGQQRGVDSGPSTSTAEQKAQVVKAVAQRERCVVLMTGATDFLSDGTRTVAISNGTPLLGKITGSGCALGSTIASYVAVHREDKFLAALAAVLHYEIAAERAGRREDVRGPGTFIPAFLDELSLFGEENVSTGRNQWLVGGPKVSLIE